MRFLSWTPATTALLFRASATFPEGSFLDERRLRERLQVLAEASLVRHWSAATIGGGLQNYYKLTPAGFTALFGTESPQPSRAVISEIAPAMFQHTMRLAEVVTRIVCACHARNITVVRYIRENELVLRAGPVQVQPDGFFRLAVAGRKFNIALEIDNATASVDSSALSAIRGKLAVYDAYQQQAMQKWRDGNKAAEAPRFRVAFLTPSADRTQHILMLARRMASRPNRRLIYAAPFDSFVGDSDPLTSPLFLDHHGHWQALVDFFPAAAFRREPIHFRAELEPLVAEW